MIEPGTERTDVAVQLLLCGLMSAAGVLTWADFFSSPDCLQPLLVTVLAGSLAAAVVGLRRSLPMAAVGYLVGLAVVGGAFLQFPVGRVGVPTPASLAALPYELGDGFGRMLSTGLPADPNPVLLAFPVLVCWTAAYASVLLSRWSVSRLAPAGPPLAAVLVALLMVAERPVVHLAPVALVFAATAVLAAVRGRGPAAGRQAGETTAGVATSAPRLVAAAVMVALATAATSAVTASTRWASPATHWDPRAEAPLRIDQQENPISQVRTQLLTTTPRTLFAVHVSAAGALPDRLRLVALDRYDGTSWTSSSTFRVAGHELAPERAPLHGTRVRVSVTVVIARGPYLLVPERPTGLAGPDDASTGIAFDPTSGDLVLDGPPRQGFSYTVTGWIGPTRLGAASGPVVTAAGSPSSVEVPADVPAVLSGEATRLATVGSSDAGRLEALAAWLRSYPYSARASAGNSMGALAQMIGGGRPGDELGYAEQHAAAFALIARILGIPSRVAVGYLLRDGRDGIFAVTEHDVHVWPEVLTRDGGWVAFEPTSTRNTVLSPPRANSVARVTSHTAAAPPVQPETRLRIVDLPSRHEYPLLRWTLLTAGSLFGATVLTVIAGAIWKAVRRRRRRLATPAAAAVIGAWQEALERLAGHGLAADEASTPRETLAQVRERVPAAAPYVSELEPLVTVAVYAPGAGDESSAARAWQLERQLRLQLRRGARAQMRSALRVADPRSLYPAGRPGRRPRAAAGKRASR